MSTPLRHQPCHEHLAGNEHDSVNLATAERDAVVATYRQGAICPLSVSIGRKSTATPPRTSGLVGYLGRPVMRV